ncbi:MAG: HAD-IA family hydrolase [Bryobacteraceae bacterium]
MIPRFRAYLFDIDGTLLDSALDICGAIQQTLEPTGCGPLTFEYLRGFIGLHLIDCFGDVLPHYTPEQMDALVQIYRTHYPARGHKLTTIYPGVAEGLAALDARKTTATTKGTNGSRAILEQFGLLPYFNHVQGTDGFPCKPAPDVIHRGIEALGAKPEDCLMVGDAPSDILAGRRAGVKTCAVRYGYGRLEEIAQVEPDYWISDLRELL